MTAAEIAPEIFLYFAYGSNMCSRRLQARTPSARAVGIGAVSGRKLTFDKNGQDGSGKCDIEASANAADIVHGVLYEIASRERAALDKAEGLGKGYDLAELDIVTASGMARAIAYVATQKNPALIPYDWYTAYVLAGAVEHKLPADYVARLRAVAAVADDDIARHQRETAIRLGTGAG